MRTRKSSTLKRITAISLITLGFGISYGEVGYLIHEATNYPYHQSLKKRDEIKDRKDNLESFIRKNNGFSNNLSSAQQEELIRLEREYEKASLEAKPYQDQIDKQNVSMNKHSLIVLGGIPIMILGFGVNYINKRNKENEN